MQFMRSATVQVLCRVLGVSGARGNERSNQAVERLSLRALLFDGQSTSTCRCRAAWADTPPAVFYSNPAAHVTAAAGRRCGGVKTTPRPRLLRERDRCEVCLRALDTRADARGRPGAEHLDQLHVHPFPAAAVRMPGAGSAARLQVSPDEPPSTDRSGPAKPNLL